MDRNRQSSMPSTQLGGTQIARRSGISKEAWPCGRPPGLTTRSVLEESASVQMVHVHIPTSNGRMLILSRYAQPGPATGADPAQAGAAGPTAAPGSRPPPAATRCRCSEDSRLKRPSLTMSSRFDPANLRSRVHSVEFSRRFAFSALTCYSGDHRLHYGVGLWHERMGRKSDS